MKSQRNPTGPASRARALGLVALGLALAGCAREVSMAEARAPEQPDVTIQYSAVRSGARLFGDYSVVNEQILTEQPPSAPAEEPEAP